MIPKGKKYKFNHLKKKDCHIPPKLCKGDLECIDAWSRRCKELGFSYDKTAKSDETSHKKQNKFAMMRNNLATVTRSVDSHKDIKMKLRNPEKIPE